MDPLSRCTNNSSSASDLAGLLASSSDYASSEANSSFAFRTPEPPSGPSAAAAAAVYGDVAPEDDTADILHQLGHPASAAESFYSRSEAGTSLISVGDDLQDASLLTDCLRRVLLRADDNGQSPMVTAADTPGDCCVYANCNCNLTSQLPSLAQGQNLVLPLASASPSAKVLDAELVDREIPVSGRPPRRAAVTVVGGCHCCCVS